MKQRNIEYGAYTVGYEIEACVDGISIIIKSIVGPNIEDFDRSGIEDIIFHCKSDFSDRQYNHYLKTCETL